MDRRHFLVGLAGGGTFLCGCLQRPGADSNDSTESGGVSEYEFRLGWSDDRDPLVGDYGHAADADIESGAESPRLLVFGQVASGSRSCMETVLHELDLVGETLTVAVSDNFESGPNEGCTSELALVSYELLVTFEEVLPAVVEVVHLDDGHERQFSETIAVH